MTALITAISAVLLSACATQQKTYVAPSNKRVEESTNKLVKAVDNAHKSANAARAASKDARSKVDEARKRQKEIAADIKKLKDVPAELLKKITDQDATLDQAAEKQAEVEKHQTDTEAHFAEADKAKVEAEQARADYYASADHLAQDATNERNHVIEVEKKLSWYRWHSLFLKIATAAIVILIVVGIILKATGKLAFNLLL
jgi:chromosome segregation ATPase